MFVDASGNGASASSSLLFSNIPGDGVLYAYEGVKSVFDMDLASPDGTKLTFQIVGGLDASRFTIDPLTGVLSFTFNPDYENPLSSAGTNSYDVTVRILTASGLVEEKSLRRAASSTRCSITTGSTGKLSMSPMSRAMTVASRSSDPATEAGVCLPPPWTIGSSPTSPTEIPVRRASHCRQRCRWCSAASA